MSSLYAYRLKKDEIKTKQANIIRYMYIHTQTVEISCIHLFYTLHLLTDNCKYYCRKAITNFECGVGK